MLDLTKPMQTKVGEEVVYIGRRSHDKEYPLVFDVKMHGGHEWHLQCVALNGDHGDRDCQEDWNYSDIINVPELKPGVNKFYWTNSPTNTNKIAKICFIIDEYEYGEVAALLLEIMEDGRTVLSDYKTLYEASNLTRELTPQELEEHGLVGK